MATEQGKVRRLHTERFYQHYWKFTWKDGFSKIIGSHDKKPPVQVAGRIGAQGQHGHYDGYIEMEPEMAKKILIEQEAALKEVRDKTKYQDVKGEEIVEEIDMVLEDEDLFKEWLDCAENECRKVMSGIEKARQVYPLLVDDSEYKGALLALLKIVVNKTINLQNFLGYAQMKIEEE